MKDHTKEDLQKAIRAAVIEIKHMQKRLTRLEKWLQFQLDEPVDFESEDIDHDDPIIETALEIILQTNTASASLLQRKLQIGYSRAAKIIDILEERGHVGPSNGQKPRQIFKKEPQSKEKTIGQRLAESLNRNVLAEK